LPAPVSVGRFVIRATQRAWGVGVPSSRSLATATRESNVILARQRPGHGHIVIGGGLASVKASGAVYAVDNGLSHSPGQIRFRRVRFARTMEESAGLTRLRKGAGDEGEGGRLPGGQGHDYRTA
jgi:hypothetical protein